MQPDSDRMTGQVRLKLEKLEVLAARLESLLSTDAPVVLAIDGRAASGKSRLAEKLAKDYAARLVHMDDFFLPQELRTIERLAEPGSTLHYERFPVDVLPFLRKEEGFNYQSFDCSRMRLGEWRGLPPAQLTIVEGSYALHPKLGAYYDLSIFMSCPTDIQLARLKARNPIKLEEFKKLWIPLEEKYICTFDIEKKADFFIES